MAIQNLADLRAAIQDWMYDRPDMAGACGAIIDLCHADLNKVLRTRRQLTDVTLVLDANGQADLPDDYQQFRQVASLSNPIRVLKFVVPDYRDYEHPFTASGLASDFSIDGNQITVRPNSTNDIRLTYWAKIPALVNDDDTNWLLQSDPGIYLYGSLKHAGIYMGDDQRTATVGAMFNGLLDALVREDNNAMYSSGRMRIRGVTP